MLSVYANIMMWTADLESSDEVLYQGFMKTFMNPCLYTFTFHQNDKLIICSIELKGSEGDIDH